MTPTPDVIKMIIEGGVAVIAIAALILYIRWSMQQMKATGDVHAVERKDWAERSDKQFERLAVLTEKHASASERNIAAISSLEKVVSVAMKTEG